MMVAEPVAEPGVPVMDEVTAVPVNDRDAVTAEDVGETAPREEKVVLKAVQETKSPEP